MDEVDELLRQARAYMEQTTQLLERVDVTKDEAWTLFVKARTAYTLAHAADARRLRLVTPEG